jgi:hypothetical protein
LSVRLLSTIIAIALVLAETAAASSVSSYGVRRVAMRDLYSGGRPLTFSDADIFACVDRQRSAEIYRVPYLYVTDQTSIPKEVLPFIDLSGTNPLFADAAIIHDYLYAVGRPGDLLGQKTADEDFVILARSQRVSSLAQREIGWAFDRNRDLNPTNPFGHEREWNRWADPNTNKLATSKNLPDKKGAIVRVLTLGNCKVFDQDSPASKRLLACLHIRYMSSDDIRFWPKTRQFEDPPLLPRPLKPYLTQTDIKQYRQQDCRAYG